MFFTFICPSFLKISIRESLTHNHFSLLVDVKPKETFDRLTSFDTSFTFSVDYSRKEEFHTGGPERLLIQYSSLILRSIHSSEFLSDKFLQKVNHETMSIEERDCHRSMSL